MAGAGGVPPDPPHGGEAPRPGPPPTRPRPAVSAPLRLRRAATRALSRQPAPCLPCLVGCPPRPARTADEARLARDIGSRSRLARADSQCGAGSEAAPARQRRRGSGARHTTAASQQGRQGRGRAGRAAATPPGWAGRWGQGGEASSRAAQARPAVREGRPRTRKRCPHGMLQA